MIKIRFSPILAGLLLIVALALSIGGCSGGGATTTTAPAQQAIGSTAVTVATSTGSTLPAAIDELSTFKSKDPFRQQALPPTTLATSTSSTTATTGGNGSTTTTTYHSTTTTYHSTTTTQPSSVTTPLHSLKVLSIDEVNGEPVVTFQVDGTVYDDKHEGAVVSTSWGQIEVVDIDAVNQKVVFLHGSETRTLAVGESFLK